MVTPNEWLVTLEDPNGNRTDSEVYSGEWPVEHIREEVLTMWNPPRGYTIRFYPIGEERVDLATGIA